MKGRRVWVLSEVYFPEETSTGYLLTRIAEGLAASFQVDVLCGQPVYSARGTLAPATEAKGGVRITRCGGTRFGKDSLLRRIINILTLSVSIFTAAMRRVRAGDLLMVVTNPPLLPFVVWLVSRLRRVPCILLVHDVYPDAIFVSGLIHPNGVAGRLLNGLFNMMYRSYRLIVVLGRDMERLIHSKLGTTKPRIARVPNWADLDQVDPRPKHSNSLLSELGYTREFVVQYAGNMGRTHGIETLMEVASRAKDIKFLFIGSGAKKTSIEKAVERLGLRNVKVLSNRPRADQRNFLNACDIAIVSFIPGMAGISVPSRIYNIMAAGKPILAAADPESELALLVNEHQLGWVVPPGDPERVLEVLEWASKAPDELILMGSRARALVEREYTFDKILSDYRNLLGNQ